MSDDDLCTQEHMRQSAHCQFVALHVAFVALGLAIVTTLRIDRLLAWLDARLAGTWADRPAPWLDRTMRLLWDGLLVLWVVLGLAGTAYLIIQHFT